MSERPIIEAKHTKACNACPWRRSNQGKRTSGGWYSRANLQRLWNGLRTSKAPGMTCHPTDPRNPPSDSGVQAKPEAETQECYGALLLIAREVSLGSALADKHGKDAFKLYRFARPKGLTRAGMSHWVLRFAFNAPQLTGLAALPTVFTEDSDIQHPEFDAPPR